MATYVVTESPNVDWDNKFNYKYRYTSKDGSPVAQAEVNRRRAAGNAAVLWRHEHGESMIVERHNV